jgi:hypothetical protein
MTDNLISDDEYIESQNNFDVDSDNEQDLEKPEYKDEEDDEKDILYDIKSPEYIKYKIEHLGSKKPCCRIGRDDYYYINTSKQLKHLCDLKNYGSNLPIISEHITKIEETIENNSNVILPIVVIEYTEFKINEYEQLLSIFDGHHRIESYKNRLKQDSNFKLLLKIQLIQSDHPESIKTRGLFRELNSVKGFSIDIKSTEFTDELCDEINKIFTMEIGKFKFVLIKDQKKVYRPNIAREEIYSIILLTLAHLQKHNNINNTDIQIKKIIKKIIELNLEFSKKPIDWFYTDKIFGKKQKISTEMFEKATKAKCFLGLVDLKVLIEKCIEC